MSSTQTLRIDKLLWYLRLYKSRSLAQIAIESGHIRLDGRRIERTSALVKMGDTITLPQGESAIAIRIASLPLRRGPAQEARAHYIRLDTTP